MHITEIPAKQKRVTIRVAAYARVSADKDAAFHSLESQTEYYKQYISARPDWVLVDIYSDNGISGTTVERPEFQRLLADCREGKIDLIVTKSITRFARNTVVLLETIRELKSLGIDCYFEKENMHSISPDGELLITLLAMYAEEEARSASENQKWKIKKRFEQGLPWVAKMLGYRLINGQITIIPEEAKVVRRIFNEYLAGSGTTAIAKRLNADGIPTLTNSRWCRNSVLRLLQNEYYRGDCLLQKTYREDFRTKKTVRNHGVVRQYYVEDSHEPIIEKTLFDAVQCEMAARRQQNDDKQEGHNPPKYLFTSLIHCGYCGHLFTRKYANTGKYKKPVWVCHEYYELGRNACPSNSIPENILIEKTKEILHEDTLTRDLILDRISDITVPEHKHLVYILKDGGIFNAYWDYPSRSSGWTPEMRQRARERALKQHQKEDK